jgi:cytochrome c553
MLPRAPGWFGGRAGEGGLPRMRLTIVFAVLALVMYASWTSRTLTAQSQPAPAVEEGSRSSLPLWAYPVLPRPARPPAADGVRPSADTTPRHVPGSSATYTTAQVFDLFGVPDWFPDDHPKMPPPVAEGRKPDAAACGYCHLPDGLGRPENESVAGLPKEYILEQINDFKNGTRKSSEPGMGSVNFMIRVAKAVTPEEAAAGADYFSKLKLTKWIRVVETDIVPKTRPSGGMLVTEPDGTEPIGSRVIEVSENLEQTELRNPRSGFIAYVPTGSLKAGEAIVTTGGGGKTMACATCHGPDLKGMGNIPGIAGRSPSQMARQLIDFRTGARNGQNAALMKTAVAKLSDDDIVTITAYLASLNP